MASEATRRSRNEIIRLCHAGLDSTVLRTEVIRRLKRAVHADLIFFATTDPSTMLFTGAVTDELLAHNTANFLVNEFLEADVNKFTSLARSPGHISWLGRATEGKLQESSRFRDILAPSKLGDEMRVALVTRKACWGVMCLHRELGSRHFSDEDAAFVAELAPHLAEGLRVSLLLSSTAPTPLPGQPGLILLNDELSMEAATPAAQAWLELVGGKPGHITKDLPGVIYTVAARLLAIERGDDEFGLPRAHLRGTSGGWIVVHASRLVGADGGGQIAILLEEAQPPEIALQIVKAYGLSERESAVAQLVLRGYATADISAELFISMNTVQDHLKKIFEKVGVSSRRELMASVFASQYMPRIITAAEVGGDGWFVSRS